jgi:tRNA nucleotidyltransferase (CCA-adding enzyme)
VTHTNNGKLTDGRVVLERLRELPGGPQLLELADARTDVELIGGASRDLLLGRAPRELDVVVADDAPAFAAALASSVGAPGAPGANEGEQRAGITLHERFGTAVVAWSGGRVDVAARRAESYPAPGALPEVSAGTPEQDLRRRDFTVNAIAVSLGGPHKGELRAAPRALEDLAGSRLRVLHDASFKDDPTRLLRLARYTARLHFEPEPGTAALAADAIRDGALATISGARVGAELRLALCEPDPVAALGEMGELGALAAIDKRLRMHEALARAALVLLPSDGRADLLVLACLLASMAVATRRGPEPRMRALLDDLEFTAGDRDRALKSVLLAPGILAQLEQAQAPSQIADAARAGTLESVALAGALAEGQGKADAAVAARRWFSELRHVKLSITGEDLLGAGVAAGPQIGDRLKCALRRKLDGELADGAAREAELSAALEGR